MGLPKPILSAVVCQRSTQMPASTTQNMPSSSAASNAALGGVQEWKRIVLMPSWLRSLRNVVRHHSTEVSGAPVSGKWQQSRLPRMNHLKPLIQIAWSCADTLRNPKRIVCVKSVSASCNTSE